jgi:sec-independent protein translocase protein TatA
MPIGGLGMGEIVLIFLVVLLLFGAKRLPEIGSALGKGIREFKGSVREIEGELKAPLEEKKSVPPRSDDTGKDEGGPRRLSVEDEEPNA